MSREIGPINQCKEKIGVNPNTVKEWIKLGYFDGILNRPGQGASARWSETDFSKVLAFSIMVKYGLKRKLASEKLKQICKRDFNLFAGDLITVNIEIKIGKQGKPQ